MCIESTILHSQTLPGECLSGSRGTALQRITADVHFPAPLSWRQSSGPAPHWSRETQSKKLTLLWLHSSCPSAQGLPGSHWPQPEFSHCLWTRSNLAEQQKRVGEGWPALCLSHSLSSSSSSSSFYPKWPFCCYTQPPELCQPFLIQTHVNHYP